MRTGNGAAGRRRGLMGGEGSGSRYLSELLVGMASGVPPLPPGLEINGLALDSRQVRQGTLFLACRGRRSSGHDYIEAAVDQGAAAIVYDAALPLPSWLEKKLQKQQIPAVALPDLGAVAGVIAARFYNWPSREVRVSGVTGTNGKSSVSYFLAHALHQASAPCGLMGTLGLGWINAMQPSELTTSDAVTVQSWLAAVRDAGAPYAVMEVSSHALDQGRVNGVSFDTAIFTNLSHDHLDYHGDMRRYLAAKAQLFRKPELRCAVINVDDPAGSTLLTTIPRKVSVIRYGLADRRAELWASGICCSRSGIAMAVEGIGGKGELNCPLLGRFNAYNLLAALGGLVAMGVPFTEALQRLSRMRPVPGRMEAVGGRQGEPLIVVDYAHTPDALTQALRSLRDYLQPGGRLWCVFGCGGRRDRKKRPLMGAAAERWADIVVLTNDNPRDEDPAQILVDIMAGFRDPVRVRQIQDRAEAIREAVQFAGTKDIVLIAGKGHEAYQHIGAERRPQNDRDLVRRALLQ